MFRLLCFSVGFAALLAAQHHMQHSAEEYAKVLDDPERVLMEVARGPSQVSMQQLAEIQQRIESRKSKKD